MEHKREQAIGKVVILRKQIYELGIKAQSMVKEIQDETDSFLSDKNFTTMDFKKVETLSKQLQELQYDYKEKADKMNELVKTFNITE